MSYNFVADSFHKKNFVADFLQAKCDFTRKTADKLTNLSCVFCFWQERKSA